MKQLKSFLFVIFYLGSCLLYGEEIKLKERYKVGLCIVATGRYDTYAEKLIASARKYFCQEHDVTYFVFTDGNISEAKDVIKVFQKRIGWPFDTLKRFHIYYENRHLFSEMDYLFATDADMLFYSPVGSEILGKRVATQHPGFVDKRGSYEYRKRSAACVGPNEGKHYFAGGFYGGIREEFFKLLEETIFQIDSDLQHNFIAVWHDESHLNRYFINHEPTLILSPSYCYWEEVDMPYEKKLVAVFKNHEELRERISKR